MNNRCPSHIAMAAALLTPSQVVTFLLSHCMAAAINKRSKNLLANKQIKNIQHECSTKPVK